MPRSAENMIDEGRLPIVNVMDCTGVDLLLRSQCCEYQRLAQLPKLSKEEADCLDRILQQAVCHTELADALAQVDRTVHGSQGLLETEHLDSYRDQQACLRERGGQFIPTQPPSEALLNASRSRRANRKHP